MPGLVRLPARFFILCKDAWLDWLFDSDNPHTSKNKVVPALGRDKVLTVAMMN
jgi:hypothetical protein